MTNTDILAQLGWDSDWEGVATAAGAELRSPSIPGRAVRHDGALVTVATRDGVEALPVLASLDPQPIVGDWVLISDGAIRGVLDRRSLLRRRARDREQSIVANVDIMFIVCGLDRPLRVGKIHRASTLAVDAGAWPIVVLTKADAVPDPQMMIDEILADDPDVEVMVTSSRQGQGIDELRERAQGSTVVLVGESGAGKSRLTNALCAEEVALVGAVREGDSKGRHTTTHREIHLLANGGVLIDTPGIRTIGLADDSEAVDANFEDIEKIAASCRFADCGHHREPGCAVGAAIKKGTINSTRVKAWRSLVDEADSAARWETERSRRAGEGRAPKNRTRRGRSRIPDDPENT